MQQLFKKSQEMFPIKGCRIFHGDEIWLTNPSIDYGYIKRTGSDNAFLYDHLKKYGLIQEDLEGTQTEYLKSKCQPESYIQ